MAEGLNKVMLLGNLGSQSGAQGHAQRSGDPQAPSGDDGELPRQEQHPSGAHRMALRHRVGQAR